LPQPKFFGPVLRTFAGCSRGKIHTDKDQPEAINTLTAKAKSMFPRNQVSGHPLGV